MPKAECSTLTDVPRSRSPVITVVLWVFLGIIAVVASFYLDAPVAAWVEGHNIEVLSPIARIISKFLDWPGLMVIGVATLIFAWVRSSRQVAKVVLAMMIASTLAGILANSSRLTTGRTRPRTDEVPQGWYGPWHEGKPSSLSKRGLNSFPSGHTATAVGFAGILLFTRGHFLLGLGLNLLALTVAWSRMQLKAHHFSDVVTATVVGLLVAWWVWSTQQERISRWAAKWISLRRAG